MHTIRRARRSLLVAALPGLLATLAAVLPASAAQRSATPCAASIDRGVLPVWGRAGFTEAKPRIAHVVGRSGDIVAILFALPLSSPPAKTHGNKILWVSRRSAESSAPLHIRAQRMSGRRPVGKPVSRTVAGGPGPSIIDLPAAGCWRMALNWSGRSDSLDLRYAAHT
jgi:hypothetical protein